MSKTIRQQLAEIKGEFSSSSFGEVKHISALLSKMERRGEIKCIRRDATKGAGRKVYVVVNLNQFKPRRTKAESPVIVRKPVAKNVVVSNWAEAFPMWFELPDFVVKGKFVNKPMEV